MAFLRRQKEHAKVDYPGGNSILQTDIQKLMPKTSSEALEHSLETEKNRQAAFQPVELTAQIEQLGYGRWTLCGFVSIDSAGLEKEANLANFDSTLKKRRVSTHAVITSQGHLIRVR